MVLRPVNLYNVYLVLLYGGQVVARVLCAGFDTGATAKIMDGLRLRGHEAVYALQRKDIQRALSGGGWDAIIISATPEEAWISPVLEQFHAHHKAGILAVIPASNMAVIEKLFQVGVSDCITRPFKVGALLDKAEALLAGGQPVHGQELPELLRKTMDNILLNGRRLGDVAEVSGGVAVHDPRARRVVCPGPEWTPVIIEEAINQFFLGEEREFYMLRRDLVSRMPRPEEYDCPEKILLRRSLTPISASLDTSAMPFSAGVYGVQTVKGLSCGYLCCLLNSRYCQFYFSRYRPPAEGLRGVYLSRADIESLPFVIPDMAEQMPLAQMAHQLSLINPHTRHPSRLIERGKLLGEMNRAIFDLQGFTAEALRELSELHF